MHRRYSRLNNRLAAAYTPHIVNDNSAMNRPRMERLAVELRSAEGIGDVQSAIEVTEAGKGRYVVTVRPAQTMGLTPFLPLTETPKDPNLQSRTAEYGRVGFAMYKLEVKLTQAGFSVRPIARYDAFLGDASDGGSHIIRIPNQGSLFIDWDAAMHVYDHRIIEADPYYKAIEEEIKAMFWDRGLGLFTVFS